MDSRTSVAGEEEIKIDITTTGNTDKEAEVNEEPADDERGMFQINRDFGYRYLPYMILGFFGSSINGFVMPLFGVLFREILTALYSDNIVREATKVMIYFFATAALALIASYLQNAFWGSFGGKIGVRIREKYFNVLLRQEVGFHDLKNSGILNTQMIANSHAITEGWGPKMGFFVQQIVSAIAGFCFAFYYSWEMTLVLLATVPAIALIGFIQGKIFVSSGEQIDPYVLPASFSNEVLMNIRTVTASPSMLQSKVEEYGELLNAAIPIATKRAITIGFGIGALMFGMFGIMYSIGLWYGSKLVDEGRIEIGDMFGCFFSVMTGGMAMGQLGSVMEDIQKCHMAAKRFYSLEARVPNIKPSEIEPPIDGKSSKMEGKIEFRNVSFAYPSAPERLVLHNISFIVEPGKSVAIVGPSGSGKSTVVALTEKFYDPIDGEIIIDGRLIHNYDEEYLRSNIGYVSQLPILFAESIAENIKGGNGELTDEQIMDAAQFADAHEFILKFPEKYETNVGQMGSKLSGGQKQRIAIARAIVNRPCILLLDEATSALDTKSEREVQRALDKIADAKSHTIMVIAHRLSTIKNCDEILVIVDGAIAERGDHQSLIEENGVYAALVRQQQLTGEGDERNEESGGEEYVNNGTIEEEGDDETAGAIDDGNEEEEHND